MLFQIPTALYQGNPPVNEEDNLYGWVHAGYSIDDARILSEYVRRERRRLRRAPRKTSGGTAEKLNVKRFARNVVQKKIKALRKYRPRDLPKLLLASSYKTDALLDGLYPARSASWTPIMKRPVYDEMPEIDLKNFSFVHDPSGTMEALSQVIRTECTQIRARLNFMDEECLDIGSYLVLQAVRAKIAPVFEGGRLGLAAQKVIDAVGLRRALNMAPFIGVTDHNDIWPFPLQQRRPGRSASVGRLIEPQKKEHVADRFVETINNWLDEVAKQQLTLEGRRLVLKVMGEALDNAERHSVEGSDDGDWAVTGFLERRLVGNATRYRCLIAFLSLGKTIAETIETAPEHTIKKMDEYIRRHRDFTREELLTVFALQDGVTKDRNAAAEGRGGTGFQDIFEFFADLGDTHSPDYHARLTIVSGATCIQAFGPYSRGHKMGGVDTERELWFNPRNDMSISPDPKHVFQLPYRLNGALITMAIDLDKVYLEETADDHD